MENILELQNISKTYHSHGKSLTVLEDIQLAIPEGTKVAIVGPSGSGKTTLLGIAAGLDAPTSGSVQLCGHHLENLNENLRAKIRNEYVGFIFQNFQLIPSLTALENVMIPLELRYAKNIKSSALELIEKVGLSDRTHHYPSQLSGGEKQRIAIARAFSNHPKILFADEPTGNLDSITGHQIEKLMFDLNQEQGTTLVIVTHNLELANQADSIIRIKGGKIEKSIPV